MVRTASTPILHLLRRIRKDPHRSVCPDAELLQRFQDEHDEAAFEEILRRHGPMVLDVCRPLLSREADAEDAFQATFLVLVRKAGSIRKRVSLASWLHGVAYRTALKARAAVVRRKHEDPVHEPVVSDPDRLTWTEVCQALHEELESLSEPHREPLVLCYLQGKTQDQAAGLLGLKKGTLKRRLERGRALLRQRLTRRGLGPAAEMVAAAWPAGLVEVRPTLLRATARSATLVATGQPAAPVPVAPHVLALAEGGTRSLLTTLLKLGTAAALALGMAGVGLFFNQTQSEHPPRSRKAAPPLSSIAEAQTKRPKAEPTRTDRYGDPLPPGALVRLGTVRLSGPAVAAPDGKTLISVGGDGAVYHWDPATGKALRRKAIPLPPEVHAAERPLFCLSSQGKTLAISAGKVLSVMDVVTGKVHRIEVSLKGYASVYRIGLSSDGKTVAAEIHGARNEIRLWDVGTGKEGPRLQHRSSAEQLTFSPDGKTLAAALLGSPVPLWDVVTGKQLRTFPARIGVYAVAFSRDGKRLATGGADGTGGAVKLWEVATGKERASLRDSAPRLVTVVRFSPDGKALAAGGQKALALWDLTTRKPLLAHLGHTTGVFFAPDGKTLFSRHGGSILSGWDVATAKPMYQHLGHEGGLSRVAYSPDGKTVATAARGIGAHALHLWEASNGRHLRVLEGPGANGHQVLFTPDNTGLVSGSSDGMLRLRDLRTDKEVRRFSIRRGPTSRDQLQAIALSVDGRRLGSVSMDAPLGEGGHTAIVWDFATREQLVHRPIACRTIPAFSPDTSLLALPGNDAIRVEETVSGRQLLTLTGKGSHLSHLVAFSPDGRHVAAVGSSSRESPGKRERVGCTLSLWELASGKEALRIDLGNTWHTALAFSPDGRAVALAGRGFLQFRDVATGRALLTHRAPVAHCWTLSFSPDGRRLAAGYEDATALIWDTTPRVPPVRIPETDVRPRDLEQAWADLDGEAGKAHAAVWSLVGAPGRAVALLEKRLEPAKAIDPVRLLELIADLGSPTFDLRESASQQLRRFADQAEPLLRTALRKRPSPEQRRRIEQILLPPLPVRPRGLLRGMRAIGVLERIGTPEARRTLRRLAAGAPAARLTREARAALKRLERRTAVAPRARAPSTDAWNPLASQPSPRRACTRFRLLPASIRSQALPPFLFNSTSASTLPACSGTFTARRARRRSAG